jgi:predicted transcriptional regulator
MATERLGERELDILQELWRRGTATVGEVHQGLLARKGEGELAYNTVQTMLNRLHSKGLVKRITGDRAHRYRPIVTENDVAGGAIQRVARRFFGGSAEALAVQLVEKELDAKELARLQRLIDRLRRPER